MLQLKKVRNIIIKIFLFHFLYLIYFFQAVQESLTKIPALPNNQNCQLHSEVISFVKAVAAREAQFLLQRYPLPGVDPEMVILSAEEGAHRLYHHATNFN